MNPGIEFNTFYGSALYKFWRSFSIHDKNIPIRVFQIHNICQTDF